MEDHKERNCKRWKDKFYYFVFRHTLGGHTTLVIFITSSMRERIDFKDCIFSDNR